VSPSCTVRSGGGDVTRDSLRIMHAAREKKRKADASGNICHWRDNGAGLAVPRLTTAPAAEPMERRSEGRATNIRRRWLGRTRILSTPKRVAGHVMPHVSC